MTSLKAAAKDAKERAQKDKSLKWMVANKNLHEYFHEAGFEADDLEWDPDQGAWFAFEGDIKITTDVTKYTSLFDVHLTATKKNLGWFQGKSSLLALIAKATDDEKKVVA